MTDLIKKLSISDQQDLDWLTDMYGAGHMYMMIKTVPDYNNDHVVNYGAGASKLISHDCWLAWQILKRAQWT